MTEQLARVIPVADQSIVLRIGGDDPYRTKQILLAMYGFLVDKPNMVPRVVTVTRRSVAHA